MKNKIDMLNGPLLKNIIIYTLPVVATGLLQLFFNAADLIVVGQFCGSECIAAVGATGSFVNLIVSFFIGFSVGAGVIVAQNVGKGRHYVVSQAVHSSMILAVFSGILLTAIGLIFSKQCLSLMNTPKEVIDLSTLYLKIYFFGAIPTLIYNFGAAILRAVGNTNGPLIYLTISGIVNIVLNIFFVTVFGMTVDGVATATVISQVVSAVLVVRALMKRNDSCKFEFSKLKINFKRVQEMLKIGLPAGLQSSVFSFSNVIIQSSINTFGAVALSGHAAAQSIDGFILVAVNSFDQPAMNFTAQNYGAHNFNKVRKITLSCYLGAAVVGIIIGLTVLIFDRQLLSIYIKNNDAAIDYGVIRLSILAPTYFLCGIMNATTGVIRGFGHSLAPTVNSIFGACVLRVVFIFTLFRLPRFHSLAAIYVSYPVTWIITFIMQIITLYVVYKKVLKKYGLSDTPKKPSEV